MNAPLATARAITSTLRLPTNIVPAAKVHGAKSSYSEFFQVVPLALREFYYKNVTKPLNNLRNISGS